MPSLILVNFRNKIKIRCVSKALQSVRKLLTMALLEKKK